MYQNILLYTLKVKGLIAQSCLTLCNPIDCILLGSSVRGIFQARILEWVAILFSRGSSWPRDWIPGLLHCSQILFFFNLSFSVWPISLSISSVQFSHSVVSDSLWPHESKHTRPPCISQTPGVYSKSCLLSHDATQPSHPLSPPSPPAPQSLSASGSFPMSQLFAWSGQSIGISASASVLPMNTQDWSPLWWIGWISLQSKGLSRVFSNTTVQKHQFFGAQLSSQSNSHIYTWPLEKP